MSRAIRHNKYNVGDIVYAKTDPKIKLIVRRYIDQVYYCNIQGESERKELVYFERELVENPALIVKNSTSVNWENEGGSVT